MHGQGFNDGLGYKKFAAYTIFHNRIEWLIPVPQSSTQTG